MEKPFFIRDFLRILHNCWSLAWLNLDEWFEHNVSCIFWNAGLIFSMVDMMGSRQNGHRPIVLLFYCLRRIFWLFEALECWILKFFEVTHFFDWISYKPFQLKNYSRFFIEESAFSSIINLRVFTQRIVVWDEVKQSQSRYYRSLSLRTNLKWQPEAMWSTRWGYQFEVETPTPGWSRCPVPDIIESICRLWLEVEIRCTGSTHGPLLWLLNLKCNKQKFIFR